MELKAKIIYGAGVFKFSLPTRRRRGEIYTVLENWLITVMGWSQVAENNSYRFYYYFFCKSVFFSLFNFAKIIK